MVYGMGTVMVFLAMLVGVTYAMSNIVNRFFPESAEPDRPATPAAPSSSSVDSKTLNIIQQAIAQHRAKKGR